nr:hypothetical protein [Streptococcus gallolyticus]
MPKITSFQTQQLYRDVLNDIELLGGSFKIYAIKTSETGSTYYTDYYDAEMPLRNDSDSLMSWSTEDEQEYQDLLLTYQQTVDYIKQYTEYDILTLEAFEERLAKQLKKNSD